MVGKSSGNTSVSRRGAVAFGAAAIGAGAMAALTGCNGMSAEEREQFEAAKSEWETALADAQSAWDSLQATISDAKTADSGFQEATIQDPDTLTAFENELETAGAVEDAHSAYEKEPTDSDSAREAVKALQDAASSYTAASEALTAAQAAVTVLTPGKGSFDYTDWDGYSYHVEYDMNLQVAFDSTEGKPGFVGMHVNSSNCAITVTNTTEGKKAPAKSWVACPLYEVTSLGTAGEYTGDTYGPLSAPVTPTEKLTVSNVDEVMDAGVEELYCAPLSSGGPTIWLNEIFIYGGRLELAAGVIENAYGTDMRTEGDEFAVGETRKYEVFSELVGSGAKTEYDCSLGEVPEEYPDLLKAENICGWVVYAPDSLCSQEQQVFGSPSSHILLSYNPVEGWRFSERAA